jgi:hypothetical protein
LNHCFSNRAGISRVKSEAAFAVGAASSATTVVIANPVHFPARSALHVPTDENLIGIDPVTRQSVAQPFPGCLQAILKMTHFSPKSESKTNPQSSVVPHCGAIGKTVVTPHRSHCQAARVSPLRIAIISLSFARNQRCCRENPKSRNPKKVPRMNAEPATISPPQQGQVVGDDVVISPMV